MFHSIFSNFFENNHPIKILMQFFNFRAKQPYNLKFISFLVYKLQWFGGLMVKILFLELVIYELTMAVKKNRTKGTHS